MKNNLKLLFIEILNQMFKVNEKLSISSAVF